MKSLYFFFLCVFLFSCTAKKQIVEIVKPTEVKNLLADSLKQADPMFNNVEIKFDFTYVTPDNSLSAGGIIRIKQDSAIWLTISPGLGIEAVRALLTPDSVFFVNRLESSFFAGNYQYLTKLVNFPINYSVIESILINQFFLYPNNEVKNLFNEYNVTTTDSSYSFVTKDQVISQQSNIKHSARLNKMFRTSYFQIVQNDKSFSFGCTEFQEIDTYLFPKIYTLSMLNSSKLSSVTIQYNKIKTNQALKYPFSIPDKYKKIIIEN